MAFAIMLPISAKAQFTRFGAQLGNGVAYISDDLLYSAPILGFQLGGYVDYEFTEWQNPWAENLYLRFGINFTRRGTKLEQVWVLQKSIRQSYLHNWYAQIPVIVGFRYEIPSLPAGNYVNFFFGPTFNVGLFGRYWDRQVTTHLSPEPRTTAVPSSTSAASTAVSLSAWATNGATIL